MELKSKWVVMILAVQVVGRVLNGGELVDLRIPWARPPCPPGCWPVVRLDAHAALATRRSFSALRDV